jgi:hypothetical protein
MKTTTLAALVLIGAGFAVTPTFPAPLNLGATLNECSSLIHVTDKKPKKKPKKRHNYTGSRGFIPGHVLTPYGYADCIGWWERHSDGRMQCHGQLIREY